jgi:hypothetical protein
MYPLGSYPLITEFRSMLTALAPKARPPQNLSQDRAPGTSQDRAPGTLTHPVHWNGEQFYGYVTERGHETEFWFRARANAITFGFSADEWQAVRELFRKAWEMPEVRAAWDALTLDYGEL